MQFNGIFLFAMILLVSLMLTVTHGKAFPQFSPPISPEDIPMKMAEMGSQFPGAGR